MRVSAVLMRGGTSKGLFIHESDLPTDPRLRDAFILAAYGSPDPYGRQTDGVGGGTSVTSKLAIVGDGRPYGVDVTYEFGQVAIDRPLVDRRGTCGNMSTAIGPFAIEEGLVEATGPITAVRILNTNTNKVVVAYVPTPNGSYDPVGEHRIPGVGGTGSAVRIDYLDPAGSVSGALFPTGNPKDVLEVEGVGSVEVSIVDAANPLVFVRWEAFGLDGTEPPERIDADPELLHRVEAVRASAAVAAGLASTTDEATRLSPSIPKLAFVGRPVAYRLTDGTEQAAAETTVRAATMSMGRMHRSFPVTGALCLAVAAKAGATIVAEVSDEGDTARIGHPSGVTAATAEVTPSGDGWDVARAGVYSTARRLMEGTVVVPDELVEALRSEVISPVGRPQVDTRG